MSKWIDNAMENNLKDASKSLPRLAVALRPLPVEVEESGSTSATDSDHIWSFWRRVLFAAWLAVLLGIVIEGILLAVLSGMGEARGAKVVIASMVQKVSWSTIVCVGLAIATTANKLRAPLMGLAGLFSAPVAFIAARSLHQSAAQALSLAAAAAGGPSPIALALVKGVEYLVLGTILGWISKRHTVRAVPYMATGLAVGIVFGSAIIAITSHALAQPMHTGQLISMSINELLFPFGCSLVLFTAGMMGKGTTLIEAAPAASNRPAQIGSSLNSGAAAANAG